MTEITLFEYIRRRRLTKSAFELQNSNAKIIEISLKYGYESPEAFARAFKNIHGVSPTKAKHNGVELKAYPCITFHISIKGDAEMKYRIEQKEAFEMFGITTDISTIDNQNFISIPKFWESCRLDGTMAKIREIGSIEQGVPLHATTYNCLDTSHSYMIGYFVNIAIEPEDFIIIPIPASTWAVFSTEELSIIEVAEQSAIMWKRIFTEWFATSEYELADTPELELHYKKDNEKYLTEIWIPIRNKNQANFEQAVHN